MKRATASAVRHTSIASLRNRILRERMFVNFVFIAGTVQNICGFNFSLHAYLHVLIRLNANSIPTYSVFSVSSQLEFMSLYSQLFVIDFCSVSRQLYWLLEYQSILIYTFNCDVQLWNPTLRVPRHAFVRFFQFFNKLVRILP